MTDHTDALRSIGLLAEDLRRRLFDYISKQGKPVGRDEAAEAVGISTKLAAFHLDKLAEAGLLTTTFARLGDRTGPGAGRTSKLYELTDEEFSVSVPPRAYELMGTILVEALENVSTTEKSSVTAQRIAGDAGRSWGEGSRNARKGALKAAEDALSLNGYEPYRDPDGRIGMRNCPFHHLAQQSPALVCGINHAFVQGILEGLRANGVEAVLEPTPGECCVRLQEVQAS
jgi:predicted ArsR family transcriptional regulator